MDYKRISTPQDAKSLHDSDRMNLRKALSGFANSEGGVILWGLETGRNNGVEAPKTPDGYADAARFVSLIEDAVSGCTVPPVPGVRSIRVALGPDGGKGIVATLIPSSHIAPHQTTDDSRAYYMRAGSSFQRVPHGVLAGMFGRRPCSALAISQTVTECYPFLNRNGYPSTLLKFNLELSNSSSVVARDTYVSWRAKELGTQYSEIIATTYVADTWHRNEAGLRRGTLLAREGHRLAPYSKYEVASMEVVIYGEPTEGLDIDLFFGCEGAPPKSCRYFLNKEDLQSIVKTLRELPESLSTTSVDFINIGTRMLGVQSTS